MDGSPHHRDAAAHAWCCAALVVNVAGERNARSSARSPARAAHQAHPRTSGGRAQPELSQRRIGLLRRAGGWRVSGPPRAPAHLALPLFSSRPAWPTRSDRARLEGGADDTLTALGMALDWRTGSQLVPATAASPVRAQAPGIYVVRSRRDADRRGRCQTAEDVIDCSPPVPPCRWGRDLPQSLRAARDARAAADASLAEVGATTVSPNRSRRPPRRRAAREALRSSRRLEAPSGIVFRSVTYCPRI